MDDFYQNSLFYFCKKGELKYYCPNCNIYIYDQVNKCNTCGTDVFMKDIEEDMLSSPLRDVQYIFIDKEYSDAQDIIKPFIDRNPNVKIYYSNQFINNDWVFLPII